MKHSAWLRGGLSVALLGVAVFALRSRLREIDPDEMLNVARHLPATHLAAACALMVVNYLQLTLYDVLGLAYLGRSLPYRRVALGSFVATAFGHNIGPSLVSGGSVRYRFFSAWGLSAAEVAALVAFGTLTFFVGFSWVTGVTLLTARAEAAPLDAELLRGIGAVFLVFGAVYVALSFTGPRGVTLRGRRWELPRPLLAVSQVVVSALDWVLMAAILTLLLPIDALEYTQVLRALLVAQVAGMLSQVPGGLGVFESVMLAALTPELPASRVLGTLVLYRLLYFFLPFAVAIALFLGTELRRRAAT